MKEYAIFYILLVVLIILFMFVILLYSDYHSRTIAPALLSSNYTIGEIGTSFSTLTIKNDTSLTANGSLLFGAGNNSSTNNLSFVPIGGDEGRNITGTIILLLGSEEINGSSLSFQVVDAGDNTVVGDPSEFFVANIDEWGITIVRLNFRAKTLESGRHNILVEAKSDSVISEGGMVLNSAYIAYY